MTEQMKSTGVPKENYHLFTNNKAQLTIPDFYNLTLHESTADIVIFIHDDVTIHTVDWTKKIVNHFHSHSSCNVIGLAGTNSYPNLPNAWSKSKNPKDLIYNVIQATSIDDTGEHIFQNCPHPLNKAVIVDGFFMALRRQAFTDFQWSNAVGKYHGYDFDICLHQETKKSGGVFIANDILVTHHSHGNRNAEWGCALIKIWNKYTLELPLPKDGTSLQIDLANLGVINTRYYDISRREAIPHVISACWKNYRTKRTTIKNAIVILRRAWVNFR